MKLCSNPPTETFAIMNTQASNMQSEDWTMFANSRHQLYFADSLKGEKYIFFKQQYKQMMPEILQSHPSVCAFYTIYDAFHLSRFRQDEVITVYDVSVL